LMIAHRASTLRNCNLILVIEDGRVSRLTTDVQTVFSEMAPIPGQA
jgi:ABC-type multidrug transport system fused ATPase/permease subunit